MIDDKLDGGIDRQSYVRYASDTPVDCRRLYRHVRAIFPYDMDILFKRLQADKRLAQTGYFRLPLGTLKLQCILFIGVNIRLEAMSKSNFEKCLRSIPSKVYFKGFSSLTSIEEIFKKINKYGKLQSLTQFELSHGVDGKLEH